MRFAKMVTMSYPTRICAVCGEEFELKPDKPGFANRCPECSIPEQVGPITKGRADTNERQNQSELNESRRNAMRDLLYRRDS